MSNIPHDPSDFTPEQERQMIEAEDADLRRTAVNLLSPDDPDRLPPITPEGDRFLGELFADELEAAEQDASGKGVGDRWE